MRMEAAWGAAAAADACANATYAHRIDDPANYNWCPVPHSSPDAFLVASLAVLAACCLALSPLSAVFVLLAGAATEGLAMPFNLGRLGNALTLWLGINPPELFFYAFLPPLLLDSALSLDYFLFKKVWRPGGGLGGGGGARTLDSHTALAASPPTHPPKPHARR